MTQWNGVRELTHILLSTLAFNMMAAIYSYHSQIQKKAIKIVWTL